LFILAEIDRPWKFDHKVKRPITINEIIDTNLPQFNIQPGGQQHKDVGCMCCASGAVEMSGVFQFPIISIYKGFFYCSDIFKITKPTKYT